MIRFRQDGRESEVNNQDFSDGRTGRTFDKILARARNDLIFTDKNAKKNQRFAIQMFEECAKSSKSFMLIILRRYIFKYEAD